MKKIFLLILFGSMMLHAQEEPLRTADIETVEINEKDYEKVSFSYGLKQEMNSRFIPLPHTEMGLRFRNHHHETGRVSSVKLFFHKTEKEHHLTTLEINFYEIDSLTRMPAQKLNNTSITYTPRNKARGMVSLDMQKHAIPFPKGGILVAVKWLPTSNQSKHAGPALRQTHYKERITYTRYKDGKWSVHGRQAEKRGLYVNAMMSLEVYFRKKKGNLM